MNEKSCGCECDHQLCNSDVWGESIFGAHKCASLSITHKSERLRADIQDVGTVPVKLLLPKVLCNPWSQPSAAE